MQEGAILREMLDTVEKRGALTAVLEQEQQRCAIYHRPVTLKVQPSNTSNCDTFRLFLLLTLGYFLCYYFSDLLLQKLLTPSCVLLWPAALTLLCLILVYVILYFFVFRSLR